MNKEEFFHKNRSILFTTRIRFSPEVQPVKETAIDKILEQNLLFFDKGMTLDRLREEGIVCMKYNFDIISREDMQESLNRLAGKGRVDVEKRDGQKLYKISPNAEKELVKQQEETDRHFRKVVHKVFKNLQVDPKIFKPPFLKCLSIIFSQLAESYVKVLKGTATEAEEFIGSSTLYSTIEQIEKEYSDVIKDQSFRDCVIDFFKVADPDYEAIKWNMAQNHYIAKVLGLDPGGVLLSKDIFGEAAFYLDTNIIISALEPKHKHHRSFKELSGACEKIGIEVKAAQITLNELQGVLIHQRELLEKVVDRIPEGTKPKVRSVFYELYQEQQEADKKVDFDSLFASFDEPMNKLKESFGVELVDDKWFIDAEKDRPTLDLANILGKRYIRMRLRRKNKSAAIHDALLLLWLKKQRNEAGANTWLITLDTTLPGALAQMEGGNDKPYAITLDALLQWISPIAVTYETEADFATVFSEAVKYHLLPRDRFFDLSDFLVFHELQIETKELPSEDVEKAIKYLKTNAPKLNPTIPSDREKLAREMAKYFADPGRKYKQELISLQSTVTALSENLQQRNAEIEELKESIQKITKATEQESLKRSANTRLAITVIVFLAIESLIIFLANKYGQGENLFQKAGNAWPFLALGATISILIGWLLIGKERLKLLGWAVTKIFKYE